MPIMFVEADEPLLIFPSIETAERYLEVRDVREGVYPRAYDPLGDVYDIIAEGRRVLIRRSVDPPRPNDLKLLLISYLDAVGEPASHSDDLATLVAAVEAHEDAFWLENDPYGDRFATRIPLWGCLVVIMALASAVYLVWR